MCDLLERCFLREQAIGIDEDHDTPAGVIHHHHLGVEIGGVPIVCDGGHISGRTNEPSHAVVKVAVLRGTDERRSLVQFVHPQDREDMRAQVGAVGIVSNQVVGHIFGTGDEEGGGQLVTQIGQRGRDWQSEPPTRPSRQAGFQRLPLRDETVMHLQGREDVLLKIGAIRLSRDDLDEQSQNHIIGVGVLEGLAHRLAENNGAQFTHALFQAGLPCACQGLHACTGGKATGLVQEVVDRDLGRGVPISHAEPGQVALY